MIPRSESAALLIGVVLVGLVARGLPGSWGDAAGGLLYSVAVALMVCVVGPRTRPHIAAGAGLAFSCAVEGLQALGVSAAVTRVLPAARWVLGTTFVASDLVVYAAGASIAYGLLNALRRRASPLRGRRTRRSMS